MEACYFFLSLLVIIAFASAHNSATESNISTLALGHVCVTFLDVKRFVQSPGKNPAASSGPLGRDQNHIWMNHDSAARNQTNCDLVGQRAVEKVEVTTVV